MPSRRLRFGYPDPSTTAVNRSLALKSFRQISRGCKIDPKELHNSIIKVAPMHVLPASLLHYIRVKQWREWRVFGSVQIQLHR